MAPTALYIARIDFAGPNSNALAGALRFTIGGVTREMVDFFHNGTAIPMASVMAACELLSVNSLLLIKDEGRVVEEDVINKEAPSEPTDDAGTGLCTTEAEAS